MWPRPLTTPPPCRLLHKKLRESNVSLRRNIVERIVKLYRITCRNLTLVNNNLSKAQGTIEVRGVATIGVWPQRGNICTYIVTIITRL